MGEGLRFQDVGRSVKAAAVFILCFAAVLVAEAFAVGLRRGWDSTHLFVHIGGALLWAILARALLRRARWAWYVVVTYSSAMILLLLFALLLLRSAFLAVIRALDESLQLGNLGLAMFFLSVVALAAALLSLLTRESREFFFGPFEAKPSA